MKDSGPPRRDPEPTAGVVILGDLLNLFHSFRLCQYLAQAASKPIRKSLMPCAIKRPLWVARNAFQPAANASCISAWMESPRPRIAFWWVSIWRKLWESLLRLLGPGLLLRAIIVPTIRSSVFSF